MKLDRIFTVAAIAVVIGGVAAAFSMIGPPAHARSLALDRVRLEDLRAMMVRIDSRHHGRSTALPERLPSDLTREDPITHRQYAYRRISAHAYELCATFALATERRSATDADAQRSRWSHGSGETCYVLDASSPTLGPLRQKSRP